MLEKGLDKLDHRRKVHIAGLMYKRCHLPEYLDVRQLPPRQCDKLGLTVPTVDLTKSFNSPGYYGSTLWNVFLRIYTILIPIYSNIFLREPCYNVLTLLHPQYRISQCCFFKSVF